LFKIDVEGMEMDVLKGGKQEEIVQTGNVARFLEYSVVP